ncbi:C40 family peptidase [Pseudonocardia phyllosphaerae]|uniref:C40 family peptidase n=1 Tax=Pseudonocardia phyllosphaerae TaxID=3390502 RepID=UPI003978212B
MTRDARRRPAAPVAAGVLVLVAAVSVATPGVASPAPVPAAMATPAEPPPRPTPPPNPGDDDLARSRQDVADRTAEVGRLTGRLSELDAEADRLQIQVASRHEEANQARDTADAAAREAETAAAAAADARHRTEEAGRVVDDARTQVDAFVGDVYTHGLDLGPLGQLSRATDPRDLMDRARMTDALSEDQEAMLDRLERARVEQANADSRARAAQAEADRRRAAAEDASKAADQALASASTAADEQRGRLDAVRAEQAEVQRKLDAAENSDAGLRAQRQRFVAWQAEQARLAAEAERKAKAEAKAREAARAAQRARNAAERERRARENAQRPSDGPQVAQESAPDAGTPSSGSEAIETVIDRATEQLGVRYSWGGGNSGGPTTGIRDGGVADEYRDYANVGFDCSGLMLYSFAGAGVHLPRYSGNQANYGELVPISDMRRGDMLSWAENGRTYHIALYLGNGKMLEAPYSGAKVRISPVRYGQLNKVTRIF